jgi:nucleoporin NDC1
MWYSGGMSASGILNTLVIPIHPGTLMMTTILWVFGVLPLIVLRKSQLTGESITRDLCIQPYLLQLFPHPPPLPPNASRPPFPSHTPFVRSHCTFSQAFSSQHLMSYSAALVLTILGFSSNRGTYSPSRNPLYKLILSSRKHPYRLSGRFLFLFMAQVTLAIGFHFRNILLDRSAVRWRHDQVRTIFCDSMEVTLS